MSSSSLGAICCCLGWALCLASFFEPGGPASILGSLGFSSSSSDSEEGTRFFFFLGFCYSSSSSDELWALFFFFSSFFFFFLGFSSSSLSSEDCVCFFWKRFWVYLSLKNSLTLTRSFLSGSGYSFAL